MTWAEFRTKVDERLTGMQIDPADTRLAWIDWSDHDDIRVQVRIREGEPELRIS